MGSTTRLCELFSKSSEQQPDLRLRLLMMLYNTFTNPSFEYRYRVFKTVIDYKRALFLDISSYMRTLGKRVDAFLQLKKYHLLFQDKPKAELEQKQVQEATLQLIKDALQLP